jgi:hypothetical protein
MKAFYRLLSISMFALLISATAFAQTPEASTLPVDEPLDVGGTILQPGVYTIRVLPSNADKNKVQITSPDLQTVYATVLTVPHQLEPNEEMPNTMFVYYPAGEGMPKALRTWFAPDPVSQGGHDIVYEESRAKQLARLARENVVSYHEQIATAGETPLSVVNPDQSIEVYDMTSAAPAPAPAPVVVAPAPAPVQIAEAAPIETREETTAVQTSDVEMPQTAGGLPLAAAVALLALGAAFAIRIAGRA